MGKNNKGNGAARTNTLQGKVERGQSLIAQWQAEAALALAEKTVKLDVATSDPRWNAAQVRAKAQNIRNTLAANAETRQERAAGKVEDTVAGALATLRLHPLDVQAVKDARARMRDDKVPATTSETPTVQDLLAALQAALNSETDGETIPETAQEAAQEAAQGC